MNKQRAEEINETLGALGKVWRENPDLRLLQLLTMLEHTQRDHCGDLYHVSDERALALARQGNVSRTMASLPPPETVTDTHRLYDKPMNLVRAGDIVIHRGKPCIVERTAPARGVYNTGYLYAKAPDDMCGEQLPFKPGDTILAVEHPRLKEMVFRALFTKLITEQRRELVLDAAN